MELSLVVVWPPHTPTLSLHFRTQLMMRRAAELGHFALCCLIPSNPQKSWSSGSGCGRPAGLSVQGYPREDGRSHQLGRLGPRRAERKLSSFREVRAQVFPAHPILSGRVHGFPFWTGRRGSLLPEAVGLTVTWLLALAGPGAHGVS